MKYKTMYGLHEARMWITTIVTGVAATAALAASHPEAVDKIKDKFRAAKNKIKPKKKLKIVVVDSEEKP